MGLVAQVTKQSINIQWDKEFHVCVKHHPGFIVAHIFCDFDHFVDCPTWESETKVLKAI